MRHKLKTYWYLWILLAVVCTACSGAAGISGGAVPDSITAAPSETATASHTPSPTATPTPAPSLTPTITLTPTPTPHPMSIQALRDMEIPGSEITIEETLEPGANYSRYYASYLSEGLKIYALLTVPNGEPPASGWPAIVFNHGYIPPAQYRTTERYIAYVDTLARNGYIVFRIDYRGHDRSEGSASGAYGSPGYAIDVLNAVEALKGYPASRSRADRDVGAFDGRLPDPEGDGGFTGHQSGRDLGRRGGFLPRPVDSLAAEQHSRAHTLPFWRAELAQRMVNAIRHAGGKSGILEQRLVKQLPG